MKRPGLLGTLFYIVAFGAPMAAALFRVWVNQDAVQIGYELSTAAQKKRELGETIRQLEVELAAERAPGRLMPLAASLGLEPAPPEMIFGPGGRRGP
jgi:hypothetical protein